VGRAAAVGEGDGLRVIEEGNAHDGKYAC